MKKEKTIEKHITVNAAAQTTALSISMLSKLPSSTYQDERGATLRAVCAYFGYTAVKDCPK